MYKVKGGIFKDTTFQEVIECHEEYGPFTSYQEAYDVWRAYTWVNVDKCHHRLEIIKG